MKNKKSVGIMTFHNEENYGAILQAYALQKKIEMLNNKSYIINYKKPVNEYFMNIFREKNKLYNIKIFLKLIITYFFYFFKNKKRTRNFKKFIKKYINLYGNYKDEKSLINNPPKLDVYITGSDQVWNAEITKGLKDTYTLNFGKENIIRASYAASLGNKSIPEEFKKDYIKKLKCINYISVREFDGKQALEKIINKKIEVTLDPTLLLGVDDWKKIIANDSKLDFKYILVYDLEKNDLVYKVAMYLSKKYNLKIVNFRRKKQKNVISIYEYGPSEFLEAFSNAEFIITNSFHGAVFSIIFNKKFCVIPHTKTFSRTENLLNILDLKEQIIEDESSIEKISLDSNIDYIQVNKKLEKEKQKSINFLKEVLK